MNYTDNIVQLTKQIEEARPLRVKYLTDNEFLEKQIEEIEEELTVLLQQGVHTEHNYTDLDIKVFLYGMCSLVVLYAIQAL